MEPLDTDFGRIGIHVCGDLYLPELDRILALKGAEIIFDPSLMWAPDGETNLALAKARAADNGVWLAVSHWNFDLPSLRSWIVDPYGQTLLGSPYQKSGVMVYEVDLDNKRRWIETRDEPNNTRSPYASDWGVPVEREGWREMVFGNRRPELYDGIGSGEVVRKGK